MSTIAGLNLYDRPRYYDLVFGSDWKAEYDFLRACFASYAARPIRSLFEPACGTGRLLVKLARAGFRVQGNDLNEAAVDYCNARLKRQGFRPTACVGDMADFELPRPVDAAFNMINSFRHLGSEAQARAHLACIARALVPGGIYILALHLTPANEPECTEEVWPSRRGHLAIMTRLWTIHLDRQRRRERVGLTLDVWTPRRQFQMHEELTFRTYTRRQFASLLTSVPELQLEQTFDFTYDIKRPIEIDDTTEDVVFLLRKVGRPGRAAPRRERARGLSRGRPLPSRKQSP